MNYIISGQNYVTYQLCKCLYLQALVIETKLHFISCVFILHFITKQPNLSRHGLKIGRITTYKQQRRTRMAYHNIQTTKKNTNDVSQHTNNKEEHK